MKRVIFMLDVSDEDAQEVARNLYWHGKLVMSTCWDDVVMVAANTYEEIKAGQNFPYSAEEFAQMNPRSSS